MNQNSTLNGDTSSIPTHRTKKSLPSSKSSTWSSVRFSSVSSPSIRCSITSKSFFSSPASPDFSKSVLKYLSIFLAIESVLFGSGGGVLYLLMISFSSFSFGSLSASKKQFKIKNKSLTATYRLEWHRN